MELKLVGELKDLFLNILEQKPVLGNDSSLFVSV